MSQYFKKEKQRLERRLILRSREIESFIFPLSFWPPVWTLTGTPCLSYNVGARSGLTPHYCMDLLLVIIKFNIIFILYYITDSHSHTHTHTHTHTHYLPQSNLPSWALSYHVHTHRIRIVYGHPVSPTSPRNSLSSSWTLGWSHTVISSMRSLKSRRWTWEYRKVWFHLGSALFFTVLVRRLLLSLERRHEHTESDVQYTACLWTGQKGLFGV